MIDANDATGDLEFEPLETGIYRHGAAGEQGEKINVSGQNIERAGAVGSTEADGLTLVVGLVGAENLNVELFELLTRTLSLVGAGVGRTALRVDGHNCNLSIVIMLGLEEVGQLRVMLV